ncbi:MAG: SoxR reducing system RseC family protein [Spirochaetales bacterium]|nr:SoxR reducing system RseC family protein [Spirochaetales bacterium]
MKDQATVLKVDDNTVTLGCGDTTACKSCGASGFCNVKARKYQASNTSNINLSVGDTVEVFFAPGKAIMASFMVLIFPLILFVLFFAGAGWIFGIESEGIKAIFGLGGLATGFGINPLYSRQTKEEPQIIRKLNTDQ